MRVCGSDLKAKRELSVSVEPLERNNCYYFLTFELVFIFTSSGYIMSLKLRRSSGSGNSVLQVLGSSNSFISWRETKYKLIWDLWPSYHTLVILSWAALAFFLVPAPLAPSSFFSFKENKFNMVMIEESGKVLIQASVSLIINAKSLKENVKAFIYSFSLKSDAKSF